MNQILMMVAFSIYEIYHCLFIYLQRRSTALQSLIFFITYYETFIWTKKDFPHEETETDVTKIQIATVCMNQFLCLLKYELLSKF